MKIARAFYNEQTNAVEIVQYDSGTVMKLDCGKWESGLRTTPNSQRYLDALAIDNPMEYARLMLSGEICQRR